MGAGVSSTQDLTFLTLPSKCTFNFEVPAPIPVTGSVVATTTTGTHTSGTKAIVPTPIAPTTQAPAYLAAYCAIPQDTSKLNGAKLPDDYEKMSLFTQDNFYKIHTDTGATENFFLPTQILDASKLKMFNNILFFVNRYDQKLYAISAG